MKSEEWFAFAVRVVGLVVALYGLGYLLDSLLFRLGYFNYPDSSPGWYVIVGVFQFVVGLYLLRGAPVVVNFAYPEEVDSAEEQSDEQATDDER